MSFFNDLNPESHYEHQVQQRQIKLLSKRKFYQVLEQIDNILNRKYGDRMSQLKEQRNLSHITKGFKNKPVYSNPNMNCTFRTNNSINQYASYANYCHNNGSPYVEFIINTTEYPMVKNMDFSSLNYFEVAENAKTYSLNITSYLGGRQINQYEIGLIFECSIDKDGIYDFDMDDNERILTSKDCPPKNTHYLDSDDIPTL